LPGNSAYGSAAMEFRILGPLEVSAGDGALKVGGPKQRAVSGWFDLYTTDEDGAGLARLTEAPGDEYSPMWSPDGSRIAFAFDDIGDPDFRSGIAVIEPHGSGLTELLSRTAERAEVPVWSPDGTRIAFTLFTGGGTEPYVVDADGGEPMRLSDEPGVVLSWTPGGRRIVLAVGRSFVTVRPDGSGEQVFVEEPPEGGRLVMDWSPDGRWIVISTPSSLGDLGGSMYLMSADGEELFRLGSGNEPSWRPEGP
jgi:TolB protein